MPPVNVKQISTAGGTSGQVITHNGSSPPSWQTPSSGGALSKYRNLIINGDFRLAQRVDATTGTLVTTAGQSRHFDRFRLDVTNSTGTIQQRQQSTTLPASPLFTQTAELQPTVADASVAAADVVQLRYALEGYDIYGLRGKTFTLSFYVYSNKTGTYCVYLSNQAGNRRYVMEYTIDSVNTWERKELTFTFDPDGTWLSGANIGMTVHFVLMAGTNYQTGTVGSWISSADARATASQVNFMDSTSNVLLLTGVQLEVANAATDFEFRSQSEELLLAQRYYAKTYDVDVKPGTNIGLTPAGGFQMMGAVTGQAFYVHWQYPVCMRAVPTITTFQPNATDTTGLWGNSVATITATANAIGQRGVSVNGVAAAAGRVYSVCLTAESEI